MAQMSAFIQQDSCHQESMNFCWWLTSSCIAYVKLLKLYGQWLRFYPSQPHAVYTLWAFLTSLLYLLASCLLIMHIQLKMWWPWTQLPLHMFPSWGFSISLSSDVIFDLLWSPNLRSPNFYKAISGHFSKFNGIQCSMRGSRCVWNTHMI